jgi:hypothetical protein
MLVWHGLRIPAGAGGLLHEELLHGVALHARAGRGVIVLRRREKREEECQCGYAGHLRWPPTA